MSASMASLCLGVKRNSDTSSGECSKGSQSPSSPGWWWCTQTHISSVQTHQKQEIQKHINISGEQHERQWHSWHFLFEVANSSNSCILETHLRQAIHSEYWIIFCKIMHYANINCFMKLSWLGYLRTISHLGFCRLPFHARKQEIHTVLFTASTSAYCLIFWCHRS